MQQGDRPSPFDRNLGTKFASKAIDWLDEQINANIRSDSTVYTPGNLCCTLIGIVRRQTNYSNIVELKEHTDFKHRLPKEEWWLSLRPLMRIMAKHDSLYESESIMAGTDRK
nr:unknown [Schistosoma japonicum]